MKCASHAEFRAVPIKKVRFVDEITGEGPFVIANPEWWDRVTGEADDSDNGSNAGDSMLTAYSPIDSDEQHGLFRPTAEADLSRSLQSKLVQRTYAIPCVW